jgi:hypothetical protein
LGPLFTLAAATGAIGQPPDGADDASPPVEAASEPKSDRERHEMLRWINEELVQHVLYGPDDLVALSAHIESLAPASLDAFVQQTAPLRAMIRSPEWQQANTFFQHYRTLDSVLPEDEREQLAAGAARLAPHDVMAIMHTLIDERQRLLALQQASQWQNESLASAQSSIIADQERMRRYALQQAATRNLRNYFPAHQASVAVRRSSYRVPGPLISSRDMARWVVWRGFFGRRF